MPGTRRSLLLLLIILLLPGLAAAETRWVPRGPEGGSITALTVAMSARRTLYAGTDTGLLFRSPNAGASWSLCGDVPAGSVTALLADPADARTVYAGLSGVLETNEGHGVFKSVDGCRTWSASSARLPAGIDVVSLAADPRDSSVLLAGTEEGVFRSTDAGATWTASGLAAERFSLVRSIVFDPTVPGRVWVAQARKGVFVSDDGGLTWSSRSSGLPENPDLFAFALDPRTGTLYAGLSFGETALYRSLDGGATWTAAGQGLEGAVYDLEVSPGPDDTVYAGTSGGFFRTSDRGASWTRATGGAGQTSVHAVAVPPAPSNIVYAGEAFLGVFKSTDRGASLKAASRGLRGAVVEAFTISPTHPNVMYASVFGRGIFRTADGGDTWRFAGQGLPGGVSPRLVEVDPRDPLTAWAAARNGLIWKTANGGAHWRLSTDEGTCMDTAALVIDPLDTDNVYAMGPITTQCVHQGETGCLGFRTRDGGRSWTCMDRGGDTALAIDPRTPSRLFSGGLEQIFRSTDAGRSWQRTSAGLPSNVLIFDLEISPRRAGPVYAVTMRGLYRSLDGGTTWRPLGTGLGRRPNTYDLAIAPSAPSVLYVAVSRYDAAVQDYDYLLFKSTDAGATWEPLDTQGLPAAGLFGLRVHPRQPGALFVASTRGGIYRLTETGGSEP